MEISERRRLFEAMIREDDDEARAELRRQYVAALDGGERAADAYVRAAAERGAV
jgi:hypothetical protein